MLLRQFAPSVCQYVLLGKENEGQKETKHPHASVFQQRSGLLETACGLYRNSWTVPSLPLLSPVKWVLEPGWIGTWKALVWMKFKHSTASNTPCAVTPPVWHYLLLHTRLFSCYHKGKVKKGLLQSAKETGTRGNTLVTLKQYSIHCHHDSLPDPGSPSLTKIWLL